MTNQETFISHLIELRNRLLRVLLAMGVVFLILAFWSKEFYTLLANPLLSVLPQDGKMIATDVISVFLVPLKITLLLAFVATLPHTLYHAWAFIAPGLYEHEKRLVLPLIVTSFLLFLCGMAFAYFLVFPVAFGFMASVTPEGVAWMTDIDKYLSFVLSMFVAFGLTFEVPIVVVMLVKMGMVSIEKLKEIRAYVFLGAFIIGAIFTPPDVISQCALAIPLWLLYEVGIIAARFVSVPEKQAVKS